MGRSQVERNRNRGRPGSKGGRGQTSRTASNISNKGGGRNGGDSSSNTSASTTLGSNSFRYEKKRSSSVKSSDASSNDDNDGHNVFEETLHSHNDASTSTSLDYLVGGNEHGASHYSVAANFYNDDDGTNKDGFGGHLHAPSEPIDVKLLSKCLSEGDTQLNYLRFDGRMRDMFQKRFYGGSSSDVKMTVTEMRALSGLDDAYESENIIGEEKLGEANTQEPDDSGGVTNDEDEAENLEDWLDDMIL